jgi:hypothetical protein
MRSSFVETYLAADTFSHFLGDFFLAPLYYLAVFYLSLSLGGGLYVKKVTVGDDERQRSKLALGVV